MNRLLKKKKRHRRENTEKKKKALMSNSICECLQYFKTVSPAAGIVLNWSHENHWIIH